VPEFINHSKVLPEIDWENPLTDGLVALFYFDGTNVIDVVTGAIAAGTPTKATDSQVGWIGAAVLPISDLDMQDMVVGDTLGIQAVGSIKSGLAYEYFIMQSFDGVEQVKLVSGYNSANLVPVIKGSRSGGAGDEAVQITETKYATLGASITRVADQYGAYPKYTSTTYYGGVKGISTRDTVRTNKNLNLEEVVVGNDMESVDFVAVWNHERTLSELDAIDINPFQLLATQSTVEKEYCLVGDGVGYLTIDDPMEVGSGDDFELSIVCTHELGYGRPIGMNGDAGGVALHNGGTYIWLYPSNTSLISESAKFNSSGLFTDFKEIKFKRDAGVLTCFLDEVSLVAPSPSLNTDSFTFNAFLRRSTGSHIGKIKSCRFLNKTSKQVQSWDFNQTRGGYTKDHYNGAIATLVGFPADSGCVRAWGVSDGLTTSIALNTHIRFPVVTIQAGSDFTIELNAKFYNLQRVALIGKTGVWDANCSITSVGKLQTQLVTSNVVTSTLLIPLGRFLNIQFQRIGTTLTTKVDGELYSTLEMDGVTPIVIDEWLAVGNANYEGDVTLKSARIFDTDTTNNRFYDCTKILGNSLIVPETINGFDGDLIGAPIDGVFVPEKNKTLISGSESTWDAVYDYSGYGEIVGYQTNGADTKAIWNFPAQTHAKWKFEFEIELVGIGTAYILGGASSWGQPDIIISRTEASINLSAGYIGINGSSVGLAALEDGVTRFVISLEQTDTEILWHVNGVSGWRVNTVNIVFPLYQDMFHVNTNYGNGYSVVYYMMRYWNNDGTEAELLLDMDFTTGDQGKIVEAIQGNHAIISNDSVVKWQPIVPVEVFTVGTGKDYTVLPNFWVARKTISGVKSRAVLYDMDLTTTTTMWGNEHTTEGFEIVAAKGLEPISGVPQVGIPNAKQYGYEINTYYRGVDVWLYARRKLRVDQCKLSVSYSGASTVNEWSITNSILSALSCAMDNTIININNSILLSEIAVGTSSSVVTANIDSCVIAHNSDVSAAHQSYYDNGTRINVSNSQVQSVNAFDSGKGIYIENNGGNEVGVDMSAWFTDAPKKDFTLTEAGQAATKSKGWNGSDIATWAYADLVAIIIEAISLSAEQSVYATRTDVQTVAAAIQDASSASAEQKQEAAPSNVNLLSSLFSLNTEQNQLALSAKIESLLDFFSLGAEQLQNATITSVDLIAKLQSATTEQQQMVTSVAIDLLAAIVNSNAEQKQIATSTTTELLAFLNSKVAQQEQYASNSVAGLLSDYLNQQVEQLQFATASDINSISIYQGQSAEQKQEISSSNIDFLSTLSSLSTEQDQNTTASGVDLFSTLNTQLSEQSQSASFSIVALDSMFFSESVEQYQYAKTSNIDSQSTLNSLSAEQGQNAKASSVDFISTLDSQVTEQPQLATSEAASLIMEFFNGTTEQGQYVSNASIEQVTNFVSQTSAQLSLATSVILEAMAAFITSNANQEQLSTSNSVDMHNSLITQKSLQEQITQNASIDLFVNTINEGSTQPAKAIVTDATLINELTGLNVEQLQSASISSVFTGALFNSSEISQPSFASNIVASLNGSMRSLSVEQFQHAVDSTLNFARGVNSLSTEQLSDSRLTEITSGFSAISEKVEQLVLAGNQIAVSIQQYDSLDTLQQALSESSDLYVIALPELEWGNVSAISISTIFGSEPYQN
jgi:hypothetical protein